MGADRKRVELIDESDSSNATSYIGLGLIASLIVGFSPLVDAIQGNGTFENAMLRFLACLAVSVIAASTIGRMLDSAPPVQGKPAAARDAGDAGNPLIADDAAEGKQ